MSAKQVMSQDIEAKRKVMRVSPRRATSPARAMAEPVAGCGDPTATFSSA
ncbi:MAG: hypothetical protein ACKVJU_14520 [Verrucomicrobiales bacterium]